MAKKQSVGREQVVDCVEYQFVASSADGCQSPSIPPLHLNWNTNTLVDVVLCGGSKGLLETMPADSESNSYAATYVMHGQA